MPADGDRVNPPDGWSGSCSAAPGCQPSGGSSATAAPTMSGLTDQQQRAISASGVSVALSAGAGCGKTHVLTSRFLKELEPDEAGRLESHERRSRLGQLVAITFTERAAREMRDRIRAACQRRLQECPEGQADYWLDLVRDLDSARISTIHSFCASLLRSQAVEAGIDPRFRVLDGAQAATLLFELTDEVLRGRLAERDETALSLVTRLGLDRLRAVIARLLAQRQEIDWAAWRDETPERLVERWQEFWRCDTVPRLLHRIGESAAARTLLDLTLRYSPDHSTMHQRRDVLVEQLPKLCGAGVSPALSCAGETPAPQAMLAAIRAAAMVQGVNKKHWISEAVFEQFKEAAASVRKAIDNVEKQMQFDAAAALPAAETALQAMTLAADVAEQYDGKKRELGVLDFNDLLIHARRLLVGEAHGGLRKRLAAQIRLLLVDEFQDTDPLQVELVKALCDNEHLRGKLFLVGDFKQSIYRFRGAQPDVFRQLRREIPPEGRLPLSLNFRSQPAILDFVNALFAEELGPDYEPLRPARPQVGPTPAVEFLWASDYGRAEGGGRRAEDKVGSSQPSPPSAFRPPPSDPSPLSPLPSPLGADMGLRERLRRREADWIARRIRNMLDAGEKIVYQEPERGTGPICRNGPPGAAHKLDLSPFPARAVRPGDFALLFRALTNVEYYEEALRRYGIDYYLVGGHAFYAQQEIYDLLNLLRTLDSPCDEVSLAGVLRSPMFGLLDETLFWLLRDREERDADVLDGLLPEEIEGQQRQQAEFALATLRELRAIKDRLPVAQLIQEALRRTGYDALLLAEFLGERKLANLQKLVEQARSFDRAGIFTLSDFITQLSEFVARQPDEPLAATNPESPDVVKLMSIHQSKGLEFPVVIVPDVARPRRVAGPPIAFTPQLGPALKDPDAATGYDLLMAAENDEDMAELSRLLYVAATRAADYLILSAGVEDPKQPTGPWMEMLARRFDLVSGERRGEGRGERGEGRAEGGKSEIRNPKSEILVSVTATEPPIRSKPVDLRRRRDLLKIVEKARQMAADGQGRRPRYLAPVAADAGAGGSIPFPASAATFTRQRSASGPMRLTRKARPSRTWTRRGLGTLVHAVLEEVDFARPGDLADLVRRLAEEHLPAAEGGLDEPIEMLGRFLASPRAAEMAAATETHRELEFLLAWPPGAASPQGRYLQGFIDCLYRGPSGPWRLVDYKTNRVTEDTLSATAGRYEMQMLVYALAAETILGSPPAELVLCFLRPGLEHRFAWDAAARQRVVELVDRALP